MSAATKSRTRLSTGYSPHQYQRETHIAMTKHRFGVLVCHRRWGKTVFAIQQLGHDASTCPRANGRYAYIAPYLKQAKSIAFLYLCRFIEAFPGSRKNESEMYVEMPNGARITLFGADNSESIRGNYFDGLVADEVADFAPHIWPEILRPALADRQGWALFIGTPKGLDSFYDLYALAQRTPGWHAAMYRADETDLPWLPPSELEAARGIMSPQAYRREFLCDFSASADDTLITIDMVSDAIARRVPINASYDGIAKVMGVDVARFGGDTTVICKRQGPMCEPLVRLPGIDNMTVASIVAQTADNYKPDAIFVDGGRGEGVIDRLRQLGYSVIEVQFGGSPTNPRYANKRAEIWDLTRDWIEDGGILPNDPNLKSDLVTPTYSFTPAGKFALESKDKMKERLGRSTDSGDALAITFAMPVLPKQMNHSVKTTKPRGLSSRPDYSLPWERKKQGAMR